MFVLEPCSLMDRTREDKETTGTTGTQSLTVDVGFATQHVGRRPSTPPLKPSVDQDHGTDCVMPFKNVYRTSEQRMDSVTDKLANVIRDPDLGKVS